MECKNTDRPVIKKLLLIRASLNENIINPIKSIMLLMEVPLISVQIILKKKNLNNDHKATAFIVFHAVFGIYSKQKIVAL
jgi:hypothetical protein